MTNTDNRNTYLIIIFLCAWIPLLTAQTENDTLNRFDPNQKKSGYWTFYLDSDLMQCEKDKANYYGYVNYIEGKPVSKAIGKRNRRDSVIYKPFIEGKAHGQPVLLDGYLVYFRKGQEVIRPFLLEKYERGVIKRAEESFMTQKDAWQITYIYFDSLHQKQPGTYLYYLKEKDVMIFKRYVNAMKHRPIGEEIFFVAHKDFHKKDRPIIGFHSFTGRNDSVGSIFGELGISRKFISGSRVDTIGVTYKDNPLIYHSINFSLMGSDPKQQYYFGQKLTYGFNFVLFRVEAGIVNYSNFKKNEPGLVAGFGFTIFGYFNEMVYFSFPLKSEETGSFPKISVSMVFN